MHVLKIMILPDCPNKDYVENYYKKIDVTSYHQDCGIDIIFPNKIVFNVNKVTKCKMGIACEFLPFGNSESGAFDLVARSSITNTPLMLANCVGIIDPGYRGEIIASFRCFMDKDYKETINDLTFTVEKGQRLVQIVAPDRRPIKVVLVDKLSDTQRGANGFGSTNVNTNI